MKRAALALALALVACAPKGSSRGAPPGPAPFLFSGTFTDAERAACREAWAFHRARWEADNGPAPEPRSVTIVQGDEVTAPGVAGPVGGYVSDGHVVVAANRDLGCPAAYHELCHLWLAASGARPDGDPGHTDPRWTWWYARAQACINDLIDARIAARRSSP